METTIGSKVIISLKEYLSYRLLKDVKAYTNKTVNLFNTGDPRRASYSVYASPYMPWAYNQATTGISIPSTISGVSGLPRGYSGMSIDFDNGRVLFNSGFSGSGLSASVSIPDINVYVSRLPEADLIAKTNFLTLPVIKPASTAQKPYSAIASAVFIRIIKSVNEAACFGGGDWSEFNIRVTGIMRNLEHLTVINDLIADLKYRTIPLLSTSVLNELGDLKDISWNYETILNNPSDYLYVDEAYMDFTENDQFTAANSTLFMGIGTIKLKIFRFPRSE